MRVVQMEGGWVWRRRFEGDRWVRGRAGRGRGERERRGGGK